MLSSFLRCIRVVQQEVQVRQALDSASDRLYVAVTSSQGDAKNLPPSFSYRRCVALPLPDMGPPLSSIKNAVHSGPVLRA